VEIVVETVECFRANPDCLLHVRAGDPGVQRCGHWAQLPNGLIVSHSIYEDRLWCDLCLRAAVTHQARVA
jgi:hypothetical protein